MSNDQKLEHDIDDYTYEAETHAPATKSSKEKWIIIGACVFAVVVLAFMYFGKGGKAQPEVTNDNSATNEQPITVDPNAIQQQQPPLQNLAAPSVPQQSLMVEVPANMPKLTNPTTSQTKQQNCPEPHQQVPKCHTNPDCVVNLQIKLPNLYHYDF